MNAEKMWLHADGKKKKMSTDTRAARAAATSSSGRTRPAVWRPRVEPLTARLGRLLARRLLLAALAIRATSVGRKVTGPATALMRVAAAIVPAVAAATAVAATPVVAVVMEK